MRKIIIAGSEGLIGKEVTNFFSREKDTSVIKLDLALGHDFTKETQVKELFAIHKADNLINLFALNDHVAAKDTGRSTLFDIPLSSFSKFMEVNLVALFSVCREFARNNQNGNIINFSSTYGSVSPRPELYPRGEKHIGYSVSKAGVLNLTRHLAAHLGPNIRVNTISPGGVEHEQDEDFKHGYSKNVPLGRMMKNGELNGLLNFLCSKDASYITGANFCVDGGWTCL